MEGTCTGIRVEIEDRALCNPGSRFLVNIGLAVIKAVAETTGIDLEFFVNGDTVCETRRVLRNGRVLETTSISSKYTVEIPGDELDLVDNIENVNDLKTAIKTLNGNKKARFEEQLKQDIVAKVDEIEEEDFASDFSTSTDANASREPTDDDDDDDDWQMYIYLGLAGAAVVGVVALLGFGVVRKTGQKSGAHVDRRDGNEMVGNDTFNTGKYGDGL